MIPERDCPTTITEQLSGLGSALRQARQARGESMEAAARAMGVSQMTVWAWETRQRPPKPANLVRIEAYIAGNSVFFKHLREVESGPSSDRPAT